MWFFPVLSGTFRHFRLLLKNSGILVHFRTLWATLNNRIVAFQPCKGDIYQHRAQPCVKEVAPHPFPQPCKGAIFFLNISEMEIFKNRCKSVQSSANQCNNIFKTRAKQCRKVQNGANFQISIQNHGANTANRVQGISYQLQNTT